MAAITLVLSCTASSSINKKNISEKALNNLYPGVNFLVSLKNAVGAILSVADGGLTFIAQGGGTANTCCFLL